MISLLFSYKPAYIIKITGAQVNTNLFTFHVIKKFLVYLEEQSFCCLKNVKLLFSEQGYELFHTCKWYIHSFSIGCVPGEQLIATVHCCSSRRIKHSNIFRIKKCLNQIIFRNNTFFTKTEIWLRNFLENR